MAVFKSFDAEFPPLDPFPGCYAVCGYIGGRESTTDNVWTPDQWNAASGGGRLRQLPVWGARFQFPPAQEATAAVEAAKALGFAEQRGIVLDLETWVDGIWVRSFISSVRALKYRSITYGSQSSVFLNPADAGYWVADWDGSPIVNGLNVLGHQYIAGVPWQGGQVDLSGWDESALDLFGKGPRR